MNLAPQLKEISPITLVAQVARENGLPCYVVGGFVRDLLLQRTSQDIDFVCVGSGIELAEAVGRRLSVSPVVYKNFGTSHIPFEGYQLEFVGARRESYRSDSRKPVVEDGTLEDDQLRRDFTINALAVSLNEVDYGKLIDPFGGVDHLAKKMLVTPRAPAETFSDDPLRMMRACRFASQLNFDIDGDAFEAIRQMAGRLAIISAERITDELNKIVSSPVPSYGFKLLFHSGLLKQFFPELVALQGVEYVDNTAHKHNFYHTLQVLDNVAQVSDDLWLRWAAILHDIAKPVTKRFDPKAGWTFHGHEERGARMVPGLFRRMKLPMNEKMEFVRKLVRLHLRPIALVKEEVTDSAIRRLLFEAGADADALMTLCRADITSKNADKVKRYLRNFERVAEKMVAVEEKDQIRNFQPPVTGDEIIRYFQLTPGKIIGELKEEIKEAILEGIIPNERSAAWEFLLAAAARRNLTIPEPAPPVSPSHQNHPQL